jgi:hypothetical protein
MAYLLLGQKFGKMATIRIESNKRLIKTQTFIIQPHITTTTDKISLFVYSDSQQEIQGHE